MTLNGQNSRTPLYGLVLAGGKSQRMGHDKGLIHWHGREQRYHMADMLTSFCNEVYISCRAQQQAEIDSRYKTLPDSVDAKGPLAGIMSAFKLLPNVAWLVIACDLPLLDDATLQFLIAQRDESKLATTFQSPFDGLPEPLITIWEPASTSVLQTAAAEGFSCPRKILIRNSDRVKILVPPDADALMNANTPEDAEKVRSILAAKVS
jgi:molybdopterin-guanine dinucleotide biosynthesis protein A